MDPSNTGEGRPERVENRPDTTETVAEPGGEQPGDRIGHYKLLQKIGEGGFGVVYMAEQEQPVRRRVAVKVIKLGMDTRQVVARFEAERQALALMDHPNIARVLDVGATDTGRPYFVMELVRGIKITQYCDQNHLGLKERLGLFVQICNAIQHAHQKGIIHRDIKPSNIMVTMHDGVPIPKVIDFGIAKATEMRLTDKTLFTQYEQFMGTPAYMSPEQAEMSGLDIDTRSDIYSLGVLLYELLTGRPPFDSKALIEKGIEEARRTIREIEPARPSTRLNTLERDELTTVARQRAADAPKLVNSVRGDLDWIVMKCLEKDRTRRYETANGLAMEVKRFLNQESVLARPPSRIYQFQKLVRRNKAPFAAAAMVLAALLLGLAGMTWSFVREHVARSEAEESRIRERRERQRAEENAVEAQAANTRLQIERAELLFANNNASEALAYLARVLRANPTNTIVAERIISALSHRNFCLPLFPLRHDAAITSAQYSRDGARILTTSKDKTARIWDAQTGGLLTTFQHAGEVLHAQFSSNSLQIVTACADKTARLWSASTGQPISQPLRHDDAVTFAEFSLDGQFVVTASSDKTARIWKVQGGEPVAILPHQIAVHCARFSPDGGLVLTACERSGVSAHAELWDARTGKSLQPFQINYMDHLRFPEFSADGTRFVIIGWQTTVWDTRRRETPLARLSHPSWVAICARFSPDVQRVVTGSYDNTARVWDLHSVVETTPPLKHEHHVLCADFSPDGRRVATGSRDNAARIWDADSGALLAEPLSHDSAVAAVQFSPDGLRLLTRSESGAAWIWDIRVGQPLSITFDDHRAGRLTARFSPDGERIVTGGPMGIARVWQARTGRALAQTPPRDRQIQNIEFSPDGKRILAGFQHQARIYDASTGAPMTPWLIHAQGIKRIEFSSDGQRVVTASFDDTAKVWNANTGEEIARLQHGDNVATAHFSPDGQRVVTASHDRSARVWDAATGRSLLEVRHSDWVFFAQFSPDGKRLLTTSKDKTACIWDAQTGQRLVGPLQHNDELYAAHSPADFSPNGARAATVAGSVAQVWDAQTGQIVSAPLKHSLRINSVRFNPDGQKIVTACQDGGAYVWDASTGHLIEEPLRHPKPVYYAEFSPDGGWLLTTCEDGVARLWEIAKTPSPVPVWLADLAEAVAGQRFTAQTMSKTVPTDKLFELRQDLTTSVPAGTLAQWARWFLADSARRQVSASSALSIPELVAQHLETVSKEFNRPRFRRHLYAQQAVQLSPANALAQAQLASLEITTNILENPGRVARIDWQSRRALRLAPREPEVMWARAQLCESLGRPAQAFDIMEQISRLGSTNAGFWNAWGLLLEKSNRMEEALRAFIRAVDLCEPRTDVNGPYAAVRFNRARLYRQLNRLADAGSDNLAALNIPAREPGMPPRLLDLSACYNLSFDEIPMGSGMWPTPILPRGRQHVADIEFDVRGMIMVWGSGWQAIWASNLFPVAVRIPVGQSCRKLHFLCAASPVEADGVVVGGFDIHYADGTKGEMPLIYGENVRNELVRVDPKEVANGVFAWTGSIADSGETFRFFKSAWLNPRPDVRIESIDFISRMTRAAPYVIAITAEP